MHDDGIVVLVNKKKESKIRRNQKFWKNKVENVIILFNRGKTTDFYSFLTDQLLSTTQQNQTKQKRHSFRNVNNLLRSALPFFTLYWLCWWLNKLFGKLTFFKLPSPSPLCYFNKSQTSPPLGITAQLEAWRKQGSLRFPRYLLWLETGCVLRCSLRNCFIFSSFSFNYISLYNFTTRDASD